jgi:hypothetical protein
MSKNQNVLRIFFKSKLHVVFYVTSSILKHHSIRNKSVVIWNCSYSVVCFLFYFIGFPIFWLSTYMTKVIVHDEGYRTWRRLSYMTKVIVHDEGYRTWRRLSYMTKVIVHDEGYQNVLRIFFKSKLHVVFYVTSSTLKYHSIRNKSVVI